MVVKGGAVIHADKEHEHEHDHEHEHEHDPAREPEPASAHDRPPAVEREVELPASPDEVWSALASEAGRSRWLTDEHDRAVHVELAEEPSRLVWWWAADDGLPTRVEFEIRASPGGTRVRVVETAPTFPIEMLAGALALAPA
jgi:uncharacterized protein YndB with AHSA1/START domain